MILCEKNRRILIAVNLICQASQKTTGGFCFVGFVSLFFSRIQSKCHHAKCVTVTWELVSDELVVSSDCRHFT